MRKKIRKIIILLVAFLMIATGWYMWNNRAIRIQDINNCVADSDCVVVYSDSGGVSSINNDYIDVWNKYMEERNRRYQGMQVKPSVPLNYFEAKCVNRKCAAVQKYQDFSPESPLKVSLSLSDKPLLNTLVTLTLSFKSIQNAPNTSARIGIPESFQVLSGSLEWNGDLIAGEEKSIDVFVKAKKTGYYQLNGSALSKQGAFEFGDLDVIYLEVSQSDAIIGSMPENNWYEPAQGQIIPLAENNERIQSKLIISKTPEWNKEFTLTYNVTPSINLPDAERVHMSIVFPGKAFSVVSAKFPEGGKSYKQEGQLSWKGIMSKGKTYEISAKLKVVETGWGDVYGKLSVQAIPEVTDFIQDVKMAEIYVDEYTGNFKIN